MANRCHLCLKRLLCHSRSLQCFVCMKSYHVLCLPNVSKHDLLYQSQPANDWFCIICASSEFPFNHYADECEFIDALSEMWFNYTVNCSFSCLQERTFNPFELNENRGLIPTDDLDPDLQYFNEVFSDAAVKNSDYYTEDTFIAKCKSLNINDDCFSMLHLNILNIWSVPKHLSELESYLYNLQHSFPILAVTETWINENSVDRYCIDGYQHESRYRNERKGGGVSLFIRQNLSYITLNDVSICNESIESLFGGYQFFIWKEYHYWSCV